MLPHLSQEHVRRSLYDVHLELKVQALEMSHPSVHERVTGKAHSQQIHGHLKKDWVSLKKHDFIWVIDLKALASFVFSGIWDFNMSSSDTSHE